MRQEGVGCAQYISCAMRAVHIMCAVGRVAASASWRFCTLQPPYCAHIIRCLLPNFRLPTSVLPHLPPPHLRAPPSSSSQQSCTPPRGGVQSKQWGTGAWGRIDWRPSVLQYALAHDAALHIAGHAILHAALHPTAMPTLIDLDRRRFGVLQGARHTRIRLLLHSYRISPHIH